MWAKPTWGFTESDLAKIQAPALIVAGDRDFVTPETSLRISRAIPNGKLHVLKGTGHWTFQTRSEILNPVVLDFLEAETAEGAK